MPTPAFIICSSGVTTDKDTGAFSIFEVVERMIVAEVPKPEKGEGVVLIERQKFVITATWTLDTKSGESFDDEFDLAMTVRMEGGEVIMEDQRKFTFTGPDLPNYRMTYNMLGLMPIKTSGTLVIESRARKVGSPSWKSQHYKVAVEKQKLEPVQAEKSTVKS